MYVHHWVVWQHLVVVIGYLKCHTVRKYSQSGNWEMGFPIFLNRRKISAKLAAVQKYCCLRRSSLPTDDTLRWITMCKRIGTYTSYGHSDTKQKLWLLHYWTTRRRLRSHPLKMKSRPLNENRRKSSLDHTIETVQIKTSLRFTFPKP